MPKPLKNAPLSVSLADTPQTIPEALTLAAAYWESKGPSSRMMSIRARKCADLGGLEKRLLAKLCRADGTKVLTGLHEAGLSKGSIAAYYAAFRRALDLAGVSTKDWPKAGTPPRRVRDPLSEEDIDRLSQELASQRVARYGRYAYSGGRMGEFQAGKQTVDLLELLRGTGMRVDVEALSFTSWEWSPEEKTLKITGKGGHERVIPVERPGTIELLGDKDRLDRLRRLSYSGHMKRWDLALKSLEKKDAGIKSRRPTPHAVRHHYATRAYEASGRDLAVVQALLGHADINTTAGYIGLQVEDLRRAVA